MNIPYRPRRASPFNSPGWKPGIQKISYDQRRGSVITSVDPQDVVSFTDDHSTITAGAAKTRNMSNLDLQKKKGIEFTQRVAYFKKTVKPTLKAHFQN